MKKPRLVTGACGCIFMGYKTPQNKGNRLSVAFSGVINRMSKSVSLSCALVAFLSTATALQSIAQQTPSAGPAPEGTVALTCLDFHRNADGTWSPNHDLMIGDVRLTPSVAYKKGQVFAGMPLVEALEASCVRPPK
jgi:hypothetical protein